MAINARTMKRPLVVEEERLNFPAAPKHAEVMSAEERSAYVRLIYQARHIALSGGKVPEIMAATGLSREEAEEIILEEIFVQ